MKCPKCGAENPEGSNFCQECGEKIVVQQPQILRKGYKVCTWINLFFLYALSVLSIINGVIQINSDLRPIKKWNGHQYIYAGYQESLETGIAYVIAGALFLCAVVLTMLLLKKKKKSFVVSQMILSIIASLLPLLALCNSEPTNLWSIGSSSLVYICFMVILPAFVKVNGVSAYSQLR